ncbi:MAG: type II toxin-antitoxin system VapC family toxin, partial [Vicinamibacterales bacterium]
MIHLDTSFLIDLERETLRDRPGAAFEFLESLDAAEVLAVSVHVLCELRTGAELTRQPMHAHEAIDQLISGLLVVYPDDRFAPTYARLLAAIRQAGLVVAAMDLLIA